MSIRLHPKYTYIQSLILARGYFYELVQIYFISVVTMSVQSYNAAEWELSLRLHHLVAVWTCKYNRSIIHTDELAAGLRVWLSDVLLAAGFSDATQVASVYTEKDNVVARLQISTREIAVRITPRGYIEVLRCTPSAEGLIYFGGQIQPDFQRLIPVASLLDMIDFLRVA